MTIEELPGSGGPYRSTDSAWITTVLALCAGVVLGVVMMLVVGPQVTPAPSASPAESDALARASQRPPTPRPTPIPADIFGTGLLTSSRQALSVDGVSFSFGVPTDGWTRYGGLYISKSARAPQGAEAMIFWARHPAGQYARDCGARTSSSIGFTAAQVAENLAVGMAGTELVSGPTDVTVGGLPAKQVVLFVRDDYSCGPGYFYTWDGEDARLGSMWGSPLLGDTITVWVLDLDGEPFIIAAETHLNAGAALEAEVQQIVDSITFQTPETDPLEADYTLGRHSATVDSTTFSFAIATGGWEPYPGEGALGNIHISKDITGPQEAEEVIYWSGYNPNWASVDHAPCEVLANLPDPPTARDVAARVASAPGTELVSGPEAVTVDGHRALHVVITVREAGGCDPGFFYSWVPKRGGALWTGTGVGDTIRVWVVDVDAGLFFIGAITTPDAAGRETEIQELIDSIQFE
jgi:hypothetical protein